MTKLDQIQSGLKQINEARFQKLCDAYLHRRGYGHVHPKGSAFGKEKTVKGTPDTWITLPNGKLAFVETTTQATGLFNKLNADIDKCFDESKTSVPILMIEKVIICHNGTLEPSEELALAQKCKEKGCLFENIGIDTLAFDLYQKFPTLAKDFLEIEIDTGQILNPYDFVQAYQKSPVATPLDTDFFFRESELQQMISALDTSEIIIISGRAGVGKSRFALECLDLFIQHEPDYIPYCVYNKGVSLYSDLKSYFTTSGKYIVLVDDANRISQLDQLLRLVNETGLVIKLLLTVRDYALDKVKRACYEFAVPFALELSAFNKNQLSDFLSGQFQIKNARYQDRIWDITKGNARLAVMTAKIAIETNRLDSLANATQIYDHYFGSIVRDLNHLENQEIMKVAGIISFFGIIDRSNEEFLSILAENFGMTSARMWEAVYSLHSLELVDLYESEIVKISDQVLATYLFFKCFIRDQLLSFSTLLENYFYQLPNKFKEALYPAINTFDREYVISRIQPSIDEHWRIIERDNENWLKFANAFWFFKTTDTLYYLKRYIDAIELSPLELSALDFKPANSVPHLSYLGILSLFQHSSLADFKIAFELILSFLEKQASILPNVMYLLLEIFRFQRHSYDQDYLIQKVVVETLLSRTNLEGFNEYYIKLFLGITSKYLESEFETNQTEGHKTLILYRFHLILTKTLKEIRKEILNFLLIQYQDAKYRDEVLQILGEYSKYPRNQPVSEIVEYDSSFLLPFITNSLDPSEYYHCMIVHKYLRHLNSHKVVYDLEIKTRFTNEAYRVAQVILDDWEQQVNLGFEEYQEYKEQRIREHFEAYSLEDYKKFLTSCLQIKKHDGQGKFNHGLSLTLTNLSNANSLLFQRVLTYLLETGNLLNYYDFPIVHRFVVTCEDPTTVYQALKQWKFNSKYSWLNAYFVSLPEKYIDQYFADELLNLYKTAPLTEILRGFEYLEKYIAVDSEIFVKVTETIFRRVSQGEGTFSFWNLLRRENAQRKLEELFVKEIALLKNIYLYENTHDKHFDYDGAIFNAILNLDRGFVIEYLEWMYKQYDYLNRHIDDRDYSFLWRLPDYNQLITEAVLFINDKSLEGAIDTYAQTLFVNRHNDALTLKRIRTYLNNFIKTHHANPNLMSIAFDIISEIMQAEFVDFLALFLEYNKNPEDFERIRFKAFDPIVWGNEISEHEKRIEILESILPLLNSVELLPHKQSMQRQIFFWKKQIERINRDAFIDADW